MAATAATVLAVAAPSASAGPPVAHGKTMPVGFQAEDPSETCFRETRHFDRGTYTLDRFANRADWDDGAKYAPQMRVQIRQTGTYEWVDCVRTQRIPPGEPGSRDFNSRYLHHTILRQIDVPVAERRVTGCFSDYRNTSTDRGKLYFGSRLRRVSRFWEGTRPWRFGCR